ncbi:hypothetical protein [Schleiferilactobacillus harbinensis]|uniref:hypothetical protein n=1 Tax=Schleiferilactobacillus harbinensis TaxID=304207 RepID=UPI0039E84D13
MELNITGLPDSLRPAIDLLAPRWDITVTADAELTVTLAPTAGTLTVTRADTAGTIGYPGVAAALRGLTEWIAHAQNERHFSYQEMPTAATVGLLLDIRHNAQLTTREGQALLQRLAMLGYTALTVITGPNTLLDSNQLNTDAQILHIAQTILTAVPDKTPAGAISLHMDQGLAPNQGVMVAAAQAAALTRPTELWATAAFTDGGETPTRAMMLGLQAVAEAAYAPELTKDWLAAQFWLMQHEDWDGFYALDQFDNFKRRGKTNIQGANPSKLLLYMDWLTPRFWANFSGVDAEKHYRVLAEKLGGAVTTQTTRPLYAYYQQLARFLSHKAHLLDAIQDAYRAGDRDEMTGVIAELQALARRLDKLHDARQALWLVERSPIGWEVVDNRFGALKQRLLTAVERLSAWEDGRLPELPEMTAPLTAIATEKGGKLGFARYHDIISPFPQA